MRVRERLTQTSSYPAVGQLYYATAPYTNWLPNGSPYGMPALGQSPSLRETCWDELHQGPPFLEGGPLNIWTYRNNAASLWEGGEIKSTYPSAVRYKYVGGFVCNYTPFTSAMPLSYKTTIGSKASAGPTGDDTWGDISSHGASAWKKYRPGKSTADLGVFIGEMSDIPRMLKTTAQGFRDIFVSRWGRNPRSAKTRKAANHWLNLQFGWRPFLSDLRKFYQTYRAMDAAIEQIRRDNGQWIERGGSVEFNEDRTVLSSSLTTHKSYPALPDQFVPGWPNSVPTRGSHLITLDKGVRVWFTARFRYYIPEIESVVWRKKAVAQLYGLEVNPALLWELTPWSWLVDWCSNVGDVFSNMDTGLAQNLTAKYAYVMGTTEEKVVVISKPLFVDGKARTHTWEYLFKRKQRVEANPFGFSLSWDLLSPRQWSILGALGITRLH